MSTVFEEKRNLAAPVMHCVLRGVSSWVFSGDKLHAMDLKSGRDCVFWRKIWHQNKCPPSVHSPLLSFSSSAFSSPALTPAVLAPSRRSRATTPASASAFAAAAVAAAPHGERRASAAHTGEKARLCGHRGVPRGRQWKKVTAQPAGPASTKSCCRSPPHCKSRGHGSQDEGKGVGRETPQLQGRQPLSTKPTSTRYRLRACEARGFFLAVHMGDGYPLRKGTHTRAPSRTSCSLFKRTSSQNGFE